MRKHHEKRERILQMGGAKAVEREHKEGKLTARERIDRFFDPGTFTEIGLFVEHRTTAFGLGEKTIPAEGVVTGYGKVNGRLVMVGAEDYTSMAGTFGEYHGKKFAQAIETARDMGIPFISMNDSAGARLQEGMDTLQAYAWLFQAQILSSGIIPQISLLLGNCLGGQAYHPVMQDFVFQNRKTGFMGIAGPAFVKTQLGEEISLEKLSGIEAHAVKSGQTHLVVNDDQEALDKTKELLSFLPQNNREKPPVVATQDPAERPSPDLLNIVPEQANQAYDVRKVIREIVDDGNFFELLKDHGRSVVIGFARFAGRPAGIVANQSMFAAGAITIDAADKIARFVRTCDLFNVPVVTLHDTPGYMIGSDVDWKGMLRHGAKTLYAYIDATVPKIAVILRKSFAGAYLGMSCKHTGADFVFAWPIARVTIVGAETAASVIFAREIKEAAIPDQVRAARIKEYRDLFENPYKGAERGYIDDVIDPADTRKCINRSLDLLANKNVVRPWRKYSNINL
ncbi:MAG: acyl-CoA carboxylase subunit beta [Chloroflexi bacterium]|nr:acyl-CoA carboxylase subunit beta [Chloroflexota bacterium]